MDKEQKESIVNEDRRGIKEDIIHEIRLNPHLEYVTTAMGSNIDYLNDSLALFLSDIYRQLSILKIRYQIEDEDLREIYHILESGKKIPMKLVCKTEGINNESE